MQPLGRLVALQYREAAFYTDDGRAGSFDVLRLHLRGPDGEMYEHDLPNRGWNETNAALQFMAKWQYQPTSLDHTLTNVEDDHVLMPLAYTDGEYKLAQAAMSGAQRALRNAEWFDPDLGNYADESGAQKPHAPPGPEPGSGNRAGVEEPSEGDGVSAELADEDADAGVEVNVS